MLREKSVRIAAQRCDDNDTRPNNKRVLAQVWEMIRGSACLTSGTISAGVLQGEVIGPQEFLSSDFMVAVNRRQT